MTCHRQRVNVPSHVAPSHGEPRHRSQADTRPGADVRLSAPEALRRQRTAAAGDQQQVDGDQNEGKVQKVQKQAGVGTDDHCGVLEPVDPQADQPSGAETCRQFRPQFAIAPFLGRGELLPEHRAKNSWQLTFRCDVSIVARHRWQRQ